MGQSFTKRFRVGGHEIGPGGEVRPSTLLDHLQEVAGEDAARWRLGVADLLPRGRTWVISRYHVEFHRFPGFDDELAVETWPSSYGETFATREFRVDDGKGRPVLRASSSWVMLDLATRRPIPLEGVVPADYRDDHRAVETTFPPLPKLERTDHEVRLPVTLRDLDVNVHVNHVVYVEWALETVPLSLQRTSRLATLEVGYRAEARQGDTIISRRGPAGTTEGGATSFVHAIVNAATGAELARLRTAWAERERPPASPDGRSERC